jgi:hypothetical protein
MGGGRQLARLDEDILKVHQDFPGGWRVLATAVKFHRSACCLKKMRETPLLSARRTDSMWLVPQEDNGCFRKSMPNIENWTMANKKIHLKSLLCNLMWILSLMQQMWAPTGPGLWDMTRTGRDKHYNTAALQRKL